MTPCKRGVSDLGCGRGHDRRRGQISWSLTPRSNRSRGDDPCRGPAVGEKRRPNARTRELPEHLHLRAGDERVRNAARRNRDRWACVKQKGNSPRRALFPLVFPQAALKGANLSRTLPTSPRSVHPSRALTHPHRHHHSHSAGHPRGRCINNWPVHIDGCSSCGRPNDDRDAVGPRG